MQHAVPYATRPMMTIDESVRVCLRKYADFSGRATRAEFWWWVLATTLASFAVSAVDGVINALLSLTEQYYAFSPLSTIFALAVLLPNLAVTARRLHDIGRTGWWQLVWLVIVGGAWLIFLVGLVITLFSVFIDNDFGMGRREFFHLGHVTMSDFIPAIVGFAIAMVVSLLVLVWWLVWLTRQGQTGPNRYGPDPRAWEAAPPAGGVAA